MSNIAGLLSSLQKKGVRLWPDSGALRFDAPKGALTSEDIRDLKEHKTAIVQFLGQATTRRVLPPLETRRADEPLRLSVQQQRLWFIEQLQGPGVAYHIRGAIRLEGALDERALKATLDDLVMRHEVLRTSFRELEGEAIQQIDALAAFPLQSEDLRGCGQEERQRRVQQHTDDEVGTPFDLEHGPLIRGRLLRLADEEHVLYVTMHHIVSDGWSLGILIREVAQLYEAHCAGRASGLKPLALQYADYAQWQRRWLSGEVLEERLEYWRDRLRSAPVLLGLPTDHARPAVQSFRGDSVAVMLDERLSAELRALAKRHDATLYMVLYSAFAVLLSRLSGQDDVVIGTSVANRPRAEVEGLIGFFVNNLALRAHLAPGLSIEGLLQQVKATTLGAFSHQEIPFEQVVEAVQPPRSLSHSPLFQVLFALQNTPQSELRVPGLTLAGQPVRQVAAQFDLSMILHESGDRIGGELIYATDLFDRSTIERWTQHLKTILAQMVRDAGQGVDAIELMDAAERRQLLEEFNATQVPYPQSCLHELFEAQVARTPDATAVIDESTSLTYAQLNARANSLAQYLRERGVGPDTLVAICLERSVELVVALLGVLKAGGAYMPLDASYPAERLEFMLKDAAPKLLLTEECSRSALPFPAPDIVALDSQWPQIERLPQQNIDANLLGLLPDHLAYVIYTSGSTGKPKGAALHQSGFRNLMHWYLNEFEFGPADRVLLVTSFSFDLTQKNIFTSLMAGAALHLAPEMFDPATLGSYLAEKGITSLNMTPSAFYVLMEAARARHVDCPALRQVFLGGEPISARKLSTLGLRPELQIVNTYGPTECTDVTHFHRMGSDWSGYNFGVPIGRPVWNTQTYILDRLGQPVPVGVTGEIYIGGAGVGRGYWRREELTAQRFVKDPFSANERARMYRTGDLGRWRADGTIEYLGRNDDQVKVRGFRIELGEIEAQLQRCTGVREAAVIVRDDTQGNKRLIGYFTLRADAAATVEEIRGHLKQSLPDYMVPAAFVQMETLPLSPNGKLDRKALPDPDLNALAVKAYEAPQGRAEEVLAGIWQELLGVGQVGRQDNFFDLGGHSLLIMQVVERLRVQGFCTDVRGVFGAASLTALAATLQPAAAHSYEAPRNGIPSEGCERITPEMLTLVKLDDAQIERIVRKVPGGAGNIQDIYPLAPLQEGILFHHLLSGDSDTYILPMLLQLDSREQMQALLNAFQTVIDRHDILRTAILWEELPRAVQVVCRKAQLPVTELSLSSGRPVLEQLRERMRPEHQRIDLREAPLVRLQVAKDEQGDRWYVLLQLHHIVTDHVSQEIVLAEVMAILRGEHGTLPKSVGYRDFVAEALHRAEHLDARGFFASRLADVDEPTAPFGLLDVHGDGGEIREARYELESDFAQRIRAQARKLSVSAATLFHVCWALVVSRCSDRDDVVFGSVLSGRLQGTAGADRVLGVFINTLPIRMRLKDATARQCVLDTRDELAALLKYEQVTLPVAQRSSGIPAGAPLFTSMLNYRHSVEPIDPTGRNGGIRVLAVHERTNYPTVLCVDDFGSGFTLTAQTSPAVDADRVIGYARRALEQLLQALEQAPHTPVSRMSVLPAAERRQLLEEFNATQVPYPQSCLHELFEAQVARTPDATAVIDESTSLTYAQLNARANSLAHYLRERGVGPDTLVAICLDRSVDLVVGLLGVLKAGGAYMPLDASYPTERLEFMLKDAVPKLLLTQECSRSKLPFPTSDIVALDGQWSEIGTYPQENIDARLLGLLPSHLAYVIYTSGSTGKPKGAAVHQSGFRNLMHWYLTEFGFDDADRVLLVTSFSFDLTQKNIFTSLMSGAALHLAPEMFDPAALSAYLNRERITSLNMTPSAFYVLMEAARARHLQCPALRQVFLGGEPISARKLAALGLRPELQIVNTYGPTECTDVTNFHRMGKDWSGYTRGVPIGRPVWNTQIYILDRYAQPVPVGVTGEIYIGGAGVGRGYWRRDDLTAQRFLKDPFSANEQARMYRTGDLGRWQADGTIEYFGRNDDQVKVRGFRIELGEIESQLQRCAGVREAAVIVREDAQGNKRLIGYYTLQAEAGATAGSLREALRNALPEYMVPTAFVQMDSLPLTPNGKLDRKSLPDPDANALAVKVYEAPQGHSEEVLASIWRELLGVERVGRQDNFFDLGGHSLLIVQLIERLRIHGLGTDARRVFGAGTLQELAATLQHAKSRSHEVPRNGIPAEGCERITPEMLTLVKLDDAQIERIVQKVPGGARNIQDIYPLAPLQEGILFHHLLSGESDTYILPMLLELDSREQLQGLLSALQTVVDRHDILRTAVMWEELPRAVQVVYRQAQLSVSELQLPTDRPVLEQIKERMRPENLSLDLRQAPVARLQIAKDDRSDHWYALLQLHHIVTDHVSKEIVLAEVMSILRGEQSTLPAAVGYRDFVGEALHRAEHQDVEGFFTTRLSDVEDSTAPFGLLDVHSDGGRLVGVGAVVGAPLARRLREQARRLNMSPATLFHVCWALVVSRCSDRDDVVFGSVLSGRLQGTAGADRVLGVFINTLPMRMRLKAVSTQQCVLDTRDELAALLEYEQASLAVAQRCSGVPVGVPLFTSILNYRHSSKIEDTTDLSSTRLLAVAERINYPLILSIDDSGELFDLILGAESSIDGRRVLGYVQTALAALLDALEHAPDTPVLDLAVIPQDEQRKLVDELQGARTPDPEKCIHELFEEQAANSPHAVAVVDRSHSLTFAELNSKANQLAHHLRQCGVRPGTLVALCVERGLEMAVGILGVLKAGAAYLPLDPAYPSERLAFMLEDAAPRVLLTQERLTSGLPQLAMPVISLDSQWPDISRCSSRNLETRELGLTPRDLAYVIYTSGSTGKPKGVMVEHANVVNHNRAMCREFALSSKDRALQFASYGFDASVEEIFPTWMAGATLFLRSHATPSPDELTRFIEEKEITVLNLPTAYWHVWVQALAASEISRSRLRLVIVGGEKVSKESLERWSSLGTSHIRWMNTYGPTEATISCTTYEPAATEAVSLASIPIGRPIENARIYILDRHMRLAPMGVAGEMFIGGGGVARGYLNRPELTAERFVKDPIGSDTQARIYRTGDLGRWRPDGNIEYVGRNDDQVKVRGFRIELGEIETQLKRCEGVLDAVVIVRDDAQGNRRLVGYFTSRDESGPGVEALRDRLKQLLPEYMVPAAYVRLDRLPLTPNGKLDRRALPDPDSNALSVQAYEPPQGPSEIALALLWQELLGVERVGRQDSFFELGGHSLLAVQLMSRAKHALEVELTLIDVFENVTLQELALRVDLIKWARIPAVQETQAGETARETITV